jgi:hypothetical protein
MNIIRGPLNSSSVRNGPVVGPCEHCNEHSGSIMGGDFYSL